MAGLDNFTSIAIGRRVAVPMKFLKS